MILCEQCPNNPACDLCLDALDAGDNARKVIPPRRVRVNLLKSKESCDAELVSVSRTAIGLYSKSVPLNERFEVELSDDFRIIGSGMRLFADDPFYVMDIEKVLRREEVLDRLLLEEFHTWLMKSELDLSDLLTDWKNRDDERIRLIKKELQKLSLLRQIDTVFLYLYDQQKVRPLGTNRVSPDVEREMERLLQEAEISGARIREQVVSAHGANIYDLFVSPLPDQTCGIALIDVTAVIAEERKRKRREWEMYRDLFGLVTKNKLLLLNDEELYVLLREGKVRLTMELRAPEDLARLRKALRAALAPVQMAEKRLFQYLVAVNEAASNTIKHGNGGSVMLYVTDDQKMCRAVIHDSGQGILLEDLPRATLLPGYSTQQSLGAGFHVMLQYCDRLYLGSSPAGTKLILECIVPVQ
ncbi:ATP-binding protein [Brevibacillus sp. TJ4]|uniref:ATP-binding protein n=1 Tax=Brevibacillus sp. TJ4 TaxID=3234853 RepID=UPI003B9DDEFB